MKEKNPSEENGEEEEPPSKRPKKEVLVYKMPAHVPLETDEDGKEKMLKVPEAQEKRRTEGFEPNKVRSI